MEDKEERILRKDADEVNRDAELLQEMKLYNAMRSGIAQGRKRHKWRGYFYGTGVAIASAAAAVLLTFNFAEAPRREVAEQPPQSFTATAQSWTDSDKFMKTSSENVSFKTILDRNLIQPVYQSVEKNGLRVEVMGAAADGRKVYIMYSVQNHSDQEVSTADFSLDFGSFKAASIGGVLSFAGQNSNQILPGHTSYFYYMNNLSPDVAYPKDVKWSVTLTGTSEEAMLSSSSKYRTQIDVPFELDTGMFKDQTRTLYPESDFTVAGQTVKLHQVVNTPLSTYVDLEFDKNNEKQISRLIEPVLIGTSGGKTAKSYYPNRITTDNSEIYTDRSRVTLVFDNKLSGPLDGATLKTFGITALDKEQRKLTVDLNKRQIITAPGSDLSIAESDGETEPGKIIFRQTINTSSLIDVFGMRLSDTYKDAKGHTHTIADGNGLISGSSSSKQGWASYDYLFNFGKKASEYPQPLTLTLESYWYPVMDTQAVKLSPKN